MDTERRKRKSGSSRNPSGNTSGYFIQTNPLLIDTVLCRLFSFADYETLKEYRLVCHNWKQIIDPMFVKKSVFASANFWKITTENSIYAPEDFQSLFMSIDEELRFTAFKFQVNLLTSYIKETYLEPNKMTMTQLEIYNIRLGDSRGYNIDNLVGPNLKILKLSKMKEVYENDPWRVSVETLALIPQIDLTDCLIVINSPTKMAPTDLKLNLCRFKLYESPEYSNKIKLHDILDFRFLRTLSLQNYRSVDPFVNFSDCAKVTSLNFMNVSINLDGKISPKELTLRYNHYRVHRHHNVEQQFLLNDYLSTTKLDKIVLEDDRIVFDYGQTESKILEENRPQLQHWH